MKIITNNIPRSILSSYELPIEVAKEFDYYDAEQLDWASFFKYKGSYYDLDCFIALTTTNPMLKRWDGYSEDGWFSGVLIKLVNDNESVIVGRYYK